MWRRSHPTSSRRPGGSMRSARLLCAHETIPAMKKPGQKEAPIIFIGATASRRGGPRSAAFAPAKAAQRSLAESMARSLWPAGIHVALIVVDGVVELGPARPSALARQARKLFHQARRCRRDGLSTQRAGPERLELRGRGAAVRARRGEAALFLLDLAEAGEAALEARDATAAIEHLLPPPVQAGWVWGSMSRFRVSPSLP